MNKHINWHIATLQFQPSKQKNQKKADFDTDFQFASTADEYNKDTWDDLMKYVKRKASSKTDDKIQKARTKNPQNNETAVDSDDGSDVDHNSDISLSDDELKHDNIKVKERKLKGKKKQLQGEENNEEAVESFFGEEEAEFDSNATFYQMNLSRPLLKAIGELKYVHPTPIQAATIPIALLGKVYMCIFSNLQQHYVLYLVCR